MNRVYTAEFFNQCAPAANADTRFKINNSNRECYLKSIYFDIAIAKTAAPFTPLPLEQNNTQIFRLVISAFPALSLFASTVSDIIPLVNVVRNGTEIVLYRPGQYLWNSFYIKDILQFNFQFYNGDAAITYEYSASLVVEIEDKLLKFAK